jgi:C4-dicarboxylate-specific signal transduction histidine kinase
LIAAADPEIEYSRLREQMDAMELRIRQGERRRTALLHLIKDVNEANKSLANQRKAMLHILSDYEEDRRRLVQQTTRLEAGRKAMIHIMGDLQETTAEIRRREQELREKQEQLVQAAKLATLGELTTGIAHELNNPLNNIGLFIGNVVDMVELDELDTDRILRELRSALQQVHKASQIISHLRMFGRAAPTSRENVQVNAIVVQALALLQEQLRLRDITVRLDLAAEDPVVLGNAIQLEQVFLNLLTNARDAVTQSRRKSITISSCCERHVVRVVFRDTGPGIPPGLERRVFDPFFTTKDVGAGTGLGLSIAYGIVRDHAGAISVDNAARRGATFVVELPRVAGRGELGDQP